MRATFHTVLWAVLGLLSVVQALSYHEPEKPRGILGEILGKLNKQKTVTETIMKVSTLRQTITVGAQAATTTKVNNSTQQITRLVTITASAAPVTKAITITAQAQTITAQAQTITQQITTTLVQMMAGGSMVGTPIPASQVPAAASSLAAAAGSTFTSGAAGLAATAVPAFGVGAAAPSVPAAGLVTVTSTSTLAAVPTAAVPAASVELPVGGANPIAAAPAVTSAVNSVQVSEGPSINLNGVSLNSVVNLGALVARPTAAQ